MPSPTDPRTTALAPRRIAAHAAPFRRWRASAWPSAARDPRDPTWADITLAHEVGAQQLGVHDVCSWTPAQVRELAWKLTSSCCERAEQVLESMWLYFGYLGETSRWTGGAPALAQCLVTVQSCIVDLQDDDPWDDPFDDGLAEGPSDGDGSLHATPPPHLRQAMAEIDALVGGWRRDGVLPGA